MDLTFTEATRCTLVAQADSAEATLPAEARLLWVADTASVQFTALDSVVACQTDTAQVSRIDGPATPADSSANLITAHFCSAAENGPPSAHYVIDLPGSAHGKLKVVALDPADSTQVIESNEVTFNGGVAGDYALVILRATSSHESAILMVTAVGSGLARVDSVALSPPDTAWKLLLAIASQSNMSVSAAAYLAAPLPACNLEAVVGGTTVGSASLPADVPLAPLGKIGSSALFQPAYGIVQPGDFAFYYQSQLRIFHLFYINGNAAVVKNLGGSESARDSTGRNFGHAWSQDLTQWVVMDSVLEVSDSTWDNIHVWAPCIVYNQNDLKFHMFYTGVSWDSTLTESGWVRFRIQRLGHATASATTPGDSMKTWTRDRWPIFSCASANWMSKDTVGEYRDGNQCRDPFVMEDPDTVGHWLMYYVGKNKDTGAYAVGLAKAGADLTQWRDYGHMYGTDESYTNSTNGFVESPNLVQHYDVAHAAMSRWLFWTQSTDIDTRNIHFQRTVHSPSDTLAADWVPTNELFQYLGGDSTVTYWKATEYLAVNAYINGVLVPHEYLAAVDDSMWAIDINEMRWTSSDTNNVYHADFTLTMPSVSAVGPEKAAANAGGVGLRLAEYRPGAGQVKFVIALPSAMAAKVEVFDVSGRRVCQVADRPMRGGETKLMWDGSNSHGVRVGSGVYFARLVCPGGRRVVRIPLVR